jgi:ankyrin repeat protein
MSELHSAIARGDEGRLRALLDSGVDPNQRDHKGSLPLTLAVLRGEEFVLLLVNAGADPNAFSFSGPDEDLTVFQSVVAFGAPETLRIFLNAGVEVDKRSGSGWTALQYAVFKRRLEKASMLLQSGADPNLMTLDGNSPIYLAIVRDDLPMVRLLLEAGADPNKGLSFGIAAIHHAAICGNAEIMRALLAAGADTNVRSPDGRTALDYAFHRSSQEVANLLAACHTNSHAQCERVH